MNNDYSYTYNNIYSENISERTEITRHFQSILEKRDQLGTTLDHSTHLGAAAIHSNFVYLFVDLIYIYQMFTKQPKQGSCQGLPKVYSIDRTGSEPEIALMMLDANID